MDNNRLLLSGVLQCTLRNLDTIPHSQARELDPQFTGIDNNRLSPSGALQHTIEHAQKVRKEAYLELRGLQHPEAV